MEIENLSTISIDSFFMIPQFSEDIDFSDIPKITDWKGPVIGKFYLPTPIHLDFFPINN